MKPASGWQPPQLSLPKCPWCQGEVRPGRLWLVRLVLVAGILPGLSFVTLLLIAWPELSNFLPELNRWILILLFSAAIVLPFLLAKSLVRYDKVLPLEHQQPAEDADR
jgi:hypothetical protein